MVWNPGVLESGNGACHGLLCRPVDHRGRTAGC